MTCATAMQQLLPAPLLPRILRERADNGVAAIEFALLATAFLVVLAGVVDVGSFIYTTAQLDAAVSTGAQYAELNPTASASEISGIVNNTNGNGWATSTVNINNSDATGCYCPTGTPGNWSFGTSVSCQSACGGGGVAGQFVTITATRNFTSMFPSFGLTPGTISRSAIVETK